MRIFIRSGNILNRKQLFRFDTVYSQKHDRVIPNIRYIIRDFIL